LLRYFLLRLLQLILCHLNHIQRLPPQLRVEVEKPAIIDVLILKEEGKHLAMAAGCFALPRAGAIGGGEGIDAFSVVVRVELGDGVVAIGGRAEGVEGGHSRLYSLPCTSAEGGDYLLSGTFGGVVPMNRVLMKVACHPAIDF
jgi:hypothetical protein